MTESINEELTVPAHLASQRVDRVVVELLPQYSRAKIQSWIKVGKLLVNNNVARPKDKVKINDHLQLNVELADEGDWLAEDIPLTVVFEDEYLLVIDKSADFVVHPAPGHTGGTVVNAALHYCPQLASLPRAGIVHRLDKDTTGLMVIAKTLEAHHSLVKQLQNRTMGREYDAVVWGELTGSGVVRAALGRHPQNRQKMAVVPDGRPAITHYRIIKRFTGCTHLRLKLETGRTHQIRVHMAHINHPIVGDPVYCHRTGSVKSMSRSARLAVKSFARQALHASSLRLAHPGHGNELSWQAQIPRDMRDLMTAVETAE